MPEWSSFRGVFHCVVHELLILLVSCSHCVGQEPILYVRSKYGDLLFVVLAPPLVGSTARHLSVAGVACVALRSYHWFDFKSSLAFTCTLRSPVAPLLVETSEDPW